MMHVCFIVSKATFNHARAFRLAQGGDVAFGLAPTRVAIDIIRASMIGSSYLAVASLLSASALDKPGLWVR